MSKVYINRHGRKPGRGLRPWLLLPKILGVGAAFGGLLSATALWLSCDHESPLPGVVLACIGVLFRAVIVPGLVVAIVMGAALLWHHGRVMLAMRWVWAKLVLTAAGVPVLHVFMASRLELLEEAAKDGIVAPTATTQFTWGLAVSLAWVAGLIVLGRHKPRLGRGYFRVSGLDKPSAGDQTIT